MFIRRLVRTPLSWVSGCALLTSLSTGCHMAPGTPLIAPANDRAIYGGGPPAVAVPPSPAFNNVAQGMNLPTGTNAQGLAQRPVPMGPPIIGSGGAVVPVGYQPLPAQPVAYPQGYPQGYVPVLPQYQPMVHPQHMQPQPVVAPQMMQPTGTGVVPASGQPQIQIIQTPQGPQYIIVEGSPSTPSNTAPTTPSTSTTNPQTNSTTTPATGPSNPEGTPVSHTTPVAPAGNPTLTAPAPNFAPAPSLPPLFDKSKGPDLSKPVLPPKESDAPNGPSIHEDDIPTAPGFLPQPR
ncbi:MAG: hypothetical protein N2112_01355 [Gemmataceae bacterium]|nr:hypothetical protein [Gemmataceae bacterium]